MLTVLGEALIDLVAEQPDPAAGTDGSPRPPHRFTARPGGSPLNVAVGLARLGHATQFMTRLADDVFGRILRDHAAGNGVGLDASAAAAEPSTLAVVSLDDQGRAAYDFYVDGTSDWQWTAAEVAALPAPTQVFHTGSLASWTGPGDAVIAELVDRLYREDRRLLTYDPNVRPRLLGDAARGRRLVERSVSRAHVVKASDEDLRFLYPDRPDVDVARDWLEQGAALVVVTRGPHGAAAWSAGGGHAERPPVPIRLADTIGAGDAFTSGLIGALVSRDLTRPDAPGGLAADELREIVDESALVAALTCERAGAEPPSADEVRAARPRLTDAAR